MHRILSALPLIAVMAMTTPAFAQETQPAEADTAAEAPVTTADQELSLGSEDQGIEIGQTYISEKVGDWDMQCVKTEAEDPCQMYQLLKDAEGNAVSEISLFRLPAGGQAVAGATVIVPLETLLTAQLRITVDGGKGKRYPFSFCNPVGCFARIGLTKADVTAFKKGNVAVVSLVPFAAPDQKVELNLSLKGFTAGYDKTTASQ